MSKVYWYLGSPYSKYPSGPEAAFNAACEIAARFACEGIPVYSPIAHTHPIAIAGNIEPFDHKIWLPFDQPMMEHAHGLIVAELASWETSVGLEAEINFFKAVGRPIIHLDPESVGLDQFFKAAAKEFLK